MITDVFLSFSNIIYCIFSSLNNSIQCSKDHRCILLFSDIIYSDFLQCNKSLEFECSKDHRYISLIQDMIYSIFASVITLLSLSILRITYTAILFIANFLQCNNSLEFECSKPRTTYLFLLSSYIIYCRFSAV